MTKKNKDLESLEKSSKSSEVTVTARNITISVLQNETEMDEAIDCVFAYIFSETGLEEDDFPEIRKIHLTGVYGNKIKRYEAEIKGKKSFKCIRKLIDKLELTKEEVELHLSQNKLFSLKLDKQEAYQNRLKVITAGSEGVLILAKFTVHGKKELRREKVLVKLTSLEQIVV